MRFIKKKLSIGLILFKYIKFNTIFYKKKSDLKPENILIGKDGYLRIADFGLAKTNIQEDELTNSIVGTPEYLAPEIYIGFFYIFQYYISNNNLKRKLTFSYV
jgi:serine/threonine protein kinase